MMVRNFFLSLFFLNPSVFALDFKNQGYGFLDVLKYLMKEELAQKYPATEIEVFLDPLTVEQMEIDEISHIKLLSERSPTWFLIQGYTAGVSLSKKLQTSFSAWKEVPIASRKIQPLERITEELIHFEKIDVSKGLAREFKGVILDTKDLKNNSLPLEARITIPEGNFLPLTSVQRLPDTRRGMPVSVLVLSGNLTLITPGIAEESSIIGSEIRVTALKTKKTLLGVLKGNHVVEVIL